MLSQNQLKYYSKLLQKKYRESEDKFIVEGVKLVDEGLNSQFVCEIVIASNNFIKQNPDYTAELAKHTVKLESLPQKDFDKLADTRNSQGIAAVFQKQKKTGLNLVSSNIVIGLENISDPGNLGTIMRNCDWFGIRDILVSKNSSEIYNPKVLRASMGSFFHLNIFDDIILIDEINKLRGKGFQILCADIRGENLFDFNPDKKTFIVFCSESHGPSGDLLAVCDKRITIPRFGNAESLNVASASAVILSHIVKQK